MEEPIPFKSNYENAYAYAKELGDTAEKAEAFKQAYLSFNPKAEATAKHYKSLHGVTNTLNTQSLQNFYTHNFDKGFLEYLEQNEEVRDNLDIAIVEFVSDYLRRIAELNEKKLIELWKH